MLIFFEKNTFLLFIYTQVREVKEWKKKRYYMNNKYIIYFFS